MFDYCYTYASVAISLGIWVALTQPIVFFFAAAAHPNVLYFLAKIILNRPQVFEPYAPFWVRPLMELAIRSNAIDYCNAYSSLLSYL